MYRLHHATLFFVHFYVGGFDFKFLLNQVAQPENDTKKMKIPSTSRGTIGCRPLCRRCKVEPIAAASPWDAVAGVAWDTQKITRKFRVFSAPIV